MSAFLLNRLNMPEFKPYTGFRDGRRQTLLATYLPFKAQLSSSHIIHIPLENNNHLAVIENKPLSLNRTKRVVVLVHGLTGSSQSPYMLRIGQKLLQEGYIVYRVNLRNCGIGKGLSNRLYHSGLSEDLRAVLMWLNHQHPLSPVTIGGFSLGGNLVLKLAGEDGSLPTGNLDSVIAVSPPLDLSASVETIISPHNRLFNDHFIRFLRQQVTDLSVNFPHLETINFPKKLNLLEFDQIYTAPNNGFKDALEYYQSCQSALFLNSIHIPTLILESKDDPVINNQKVQIPSHSYFDHIVTQHGGHIGWIGQVKNYLPNRWMDELIVNWVNWFNQNN